MITHDISALQAIRLTEENSCEIADRWLEICSGIFADNAGYTFDAAGNPSFEPSELLQPLSTEHLIQLLTVADRLDRYYDTEGVADTADYRLSILTHLRTLAIGGNAEAERALTRRLRQNLELKI